MSSGIEATTSSELKTTAFPSNGQLLVDETPQVVKNCLAAMRADLAEFPAWSGAPEPTDEFLLMFLRSEVFSPSKAAKRYRKFWKVKVSLCGEDKAACGIKVDDCKDELDAEFLQILPGSKDIEGRQVLLVNTGQADKSLDRTRRVLAVWYVLLAALEEVETQRRGFCFIVTLKTAKITQVDQQFNKMVLDSIQGALPVRVGSMNMCYPPSFFKVLWTVISTFLQKRVRQRFHFYTGSDADVLGALRPMVAPEDLPPPIGLKKLDFARWLEERERAET